MPKWQTNNETTDIYTGYPGYTEGYLSATCLPAFDLPTHTLPVRDRDIELYIQLERGRQHEYPSVFFLDTFRTFFPLERVACETLEQRSCCLYLPRLEVRGVLILANCRQFNCN